MSFWKTMFDSIHDNWYILVAAAVSILLYAISIYLGFAVLKHFDKTKGDGLKKSTYYCLDVLYTLFVCTISMFPLFGMFGTVYSLIGLGGVFQTDNADMNSIKSEFFLALTSTAWGIIFSVFFKLLNSIAQPFIENQIEKAKRSLKI